MVPCPINQAQTIEFEERRRFKLKCSSKLSPNLKPGCLSNIFVMNETAIVSKVILGKVRESDICIKYSSSLQ